MRIYKNEVVAKDKTISVQTEAYKKCAIPYIEVCYKIVVDGKKIQVARIIRPMKKGNTSEEPGSKTHCSKTHCRKRINSVAKDIEVMICSLAKAYTVVLNTEAVSTLSKPEQEELYKVLQDDCKLYNDRYMNDIKANIDNIKALIDEELQFLTTHIAQNQLATLSYGNNNNGLDVLKRLISQ
jgi:hypothetical protein